MPASVNWETTATKTMRDKVDANDVTKLRQGIDDAMSNVHTWLVEVEEPEAVEPRTKKTLNLSKRHSYHGKDRLIRSRRRKAPRTKDDKLIDYRRNTVDGDCRETFVKDVLLNTDYNEIVSELDTFMKTYFEDIYRKVRTLPFPLKDADLELTLDVCVELDESAQSDSGELRETSESLGGSCLSIYCNDSDTDLNKGIPGDSDILKDEKKSCYDLNKEENSVSCTKTTHNDVSNTELRIKDDNQQDPNLNVHPDLCLKESDTNQYQCVGEKQEDPIVIVNLHYEDLGNDDSVYTDKSTLDDDTNGHPNDKHQDDASTKCLDQHVNEPQHNEEGECNPNSRPKSVVFEIDIINANQDHPEVAATNMCPREAPIDSSILPASLPGTDANSRQEKTNREEHGSNLSTEQERNSYICLSSGDCEDLKECLDVQSNDILNESCSSERINMVNMGLSAEQVENSSSSSDEKQELGRSLYDDSLLTIIYEQVTALSANVIDQGIDVDSDTSTCLTDKTSNDDLDKCFTHIPENDLNTRAEQVGISTEEEDVLESSVSGGEGNLSLGFSTDEQTYDSSTCDSFRVTEDSSICSSGKETNEHEDAMLTASTLGNLESTSVDSHTISFHSSDQENDSNAHASTEVVVVDDLAIQSDEEDTSSISDTKNDSCTSFEIIDDWNPDLKTEPIHHTDACNTVLRVSDQNTHLKDGVLNRWSRRRNTERDSTQFSSFEVLAEPNTISGIEKGSEKTKYLDIKKVTTCKSSVHIRHIEKSCLSVDNVMDDSPSSIGRSRLDDPYIFSSFEHLEDNTNNYYFRRTRECDTSASSSFVHLDNPDLFSNEKNVEDSGISLSAEKGDGDCVRLVGGHVEKKHRRLDCVSYGDEYRLAPNPRRRIRLDSRERNKRKFKKKGKTWLACAPFLCTK